MMFLDYNFSLKIIGGLNFVKICMKMLLKLTIFIDNEFKKHQQFCEMNEKDPKD